MPCDTKLKPQQTIEQRKAEVRAAIAKIDAAIAQGRVKPGVGKQGALVLPGLTDEERDGVTDACAYRRLMVSGSSLTKAAFARAEQLAGRSIDRQVIGRGVHSHDGGATWHDHKG